MKEIRQASSVTRREYLGFELGMFLSCQYPADLKALDPAVIDDIADLLNDSRYEVRTGAALGMIGAPTVGTLSGREAAWALELKSWRGIAPDQSPGYAFIFAGINIKREAGLEL